MDLVKIRKKAKSARKKPAEKQVAQDSSVLSSDLPEVEEIKPPSLDEAEVSADQSRVDETVQVVVPASDRESGLQEIDPIEALFAFRVDAGTLATEELYLKSLMGDEESNESDQQQWLTFSLGEEEYALELGVVNEIIKTREMTDVPRVPDFIRGIISLRGIIVPVFDLRCRLNIGSVEPGPLTRIIVCHKDGNLAGLLVDCINKVVSIQNCNIEPPPTVLSGLDRDFVEGVGRVDGKMLILLHLSNVINAELS